MTTPVPLAVFCDFDGTVTRRDVGYWLFHHFSGGRTEILIPDWKAGRLSSRECLLREAEMSRLAPEELTPFLDQFEIDPTFIDFVRLCDRRNIPFRIVSDGLDIYIHHILRRYGLDHLPVTCNHARLENRTFTLEFPHDNGACPRCGNCKGERIREFRSQHEGLVTVVFIGDGYSDVCALPEADCVFAKKDLEKYCQSHNIDHNTYRTFTDVTRRMVECGLLTLPLDHD